MAEQSNLRTHTQLPTIHHQSVSFRDLAPLCARGAEIAMLNGASRIEELEQEAARAGAVVVDSPAEIGATVRRVLAEHGLL